MQKLPFADSLKIIARGSWNWWTSHPVVVSFEVTDSCTAYCKHCDHGGPKDDSRNLKPEDYRRYMQVLRPAVVQVSGGEPLLREDVVDIVRNIKSKSGLPFVIFVSNWSRMTLEKYEELHRAGVNQFSVSLDFPDERHDAFRCLPGLFEHLDEIVPKAAALGYDDIALNTCITSENVGFINAAADKAREWGVNINYSAYSPRRTGNREYFLETPEQLATLRSELNRIKQRMDNSHWIATTQCTLDHTQQYFENGGMPGCKAGLRWLVVTSQGALQPCSMQFTRYGLHEQKRMVREFTAHNTCDECYVSIRSYLDKTYPRLFWENVSGFLSFKRRRKETAEAQTVEA
ncbi:MAG: radical SAM protein [Acidobacteriia bacterium]|nr:radical SAM protein [Terriglobia bacterium]